MFALQLHRPGSVQSHRNRHNTSDSAIRKRKRRLKHTHTLSPFSDFDMARNSSREIMGSARDGSELAAPCRLMEASDRTDGWRKRRLAMAESGVILRQMKQRLSFPFLLVQKSHISTGEREFTVSSFNHRLNDLEGPHWG